MFTTILVFVSLTSIGLYIYFFKTTIIYKTLMYYDKMSNYFISNKLFYETIDDNYNIIKITNLESRSIVILNFNIYNKEKKIIYDNSININNLESYNIKNPIIYASLIIVDSDKSTPPIDEYG